MQFESISGIKSNFFWGEKYALPHPVHNGPCGHDQYYLAIDNIWYAEFMLRNSPNLSN